MAANFRFKLRINGHLSEQWLKTDYLLHEGETVTLYGTKYIIDKVIQKAGNVYILDLREEVRTPIVIEEKKERKGKIKRIWEVIHHG